MNYIITLNTWFPQEHVAVSIVSLCKLHSLAPWTLDTLSGRQDDVSFFSFFSLSLTHDLVQGAKVIRSLFLSPFHLANFFSNTAAGTKEPFRVTQLLDG